MMKRFKNVCMIAVVATAAVGCAGNLPEVEHGQAAGEWQVHMPGTPSPYRKLALGAQGGGQPSAASRNLEQLMAASEPTAKPRRGHTVHAKTARRTVIAEAPQSPAKPVARHATPTRAAALIASAEPAVQRYAQREAQSRKLEEFRGGDAIVISASALVIVLLIVILVLLLR